MISLCSLSSTFRILYLHFNGVQYGHKVFLLYYWLVVRDRYYGRLHIIAGSIQNLPSNQHFSSLWRWEGRVRFFLTYVQVYRHLLAVQHPLLLFYTPRLPAWYALVHTEYQLAKDRRSGLSCMPPPSESTIYHERPHVKTIMGVRINYSFQKQHFLPVSWPMCSVVQQSPLQKRLLREGPTPNQRHP